MGQVRGAVDSSIGNRKSQIGNLLYDVHTHIGLDLGFMLRGWWPYACTAQDLLQHLDAHGIDRAVCFPFGLPSAFDPYAFADQKRVKLLSGRVPFDRENALLIQEIERLEASNRLHVLAMFDPNREVGGQIANLEPLAGKITGLKVQPTILESPITGLLDAGRDLMALAEQHDWPVLIHTSYLPADPWSQIADCLAVAETFPAVRFNLAHSLRFHAESLRQAAATPNVWVDCSAHLIHCFAAAQDSPIIPPKGQRVDADYTQPAEVLQVIFEMIGDTYLWGSDNPFMSWVDDEFAGVYSYAQEAAVLHALPEPVRRSMASEAPRAWLFGNASM